MKKLLLLIVLLPLSIIAQEFDYGLNLGANISYVTNDGLTNSPLQRTDNVGVGLLLGVYGDYSISDNLILDTEINYRQKRIETNSNNSEVDNPKLNFIDLSPSLKYSFGKSLKQGFFVSLGSRISFLTKSETDNGDEIEDFFNNTTFGAQTALGYSFDNLIIIQMKLDYELSNLLESDFSDGNTNSLGVFLSAKLNINKLIK